MKNFGFKEWFSLLIIPVIYGNMYLFFYITKNSLTVNIIDAVLRITLMSILIYLFRHLLKNHWNEFKQKRKRKWIYIVLGAIALQIIISLVTKYSPTIETQTPEMLDGLDFDLLSSSWTLYFIMLFTSLSSSATAIIEDIAFKHTLLKKILTNSTFANIIIVIVNSIIFGAIHYANFGNSVINTIPYMFAGLFLNIIYLKTKNLWYVLLIHLLNNFVLATVTTIFLGLFKIIM